MTEINFVLIIISGCCASSFDPFFIHFTDKQMDNKEVNDPLTSVTLIRGKSTLTVFYCIHMECWYTSERQVALFFHDAPDPAYLSAWQEKEREEKKIMSHTWERL